MAQRGGRLMLASCFMSGERGNDFLLPNNNFKAFLLVHEEFSEP